MFEIHYSPAATIVSAAPNDPGGILSFFQLSWKAGTAALPPPNSHAMVAL
jgi:hypothetical protein